MQASASSLASKRATEEACAAGAAMETGKRKWRLSPAAWALTWQLRLNTASAAAYEGLVLGAIVQGE